ncbi:MAG: hypothetical protein KKC05_03460, partial [Nanoarchaeota archaeon]|nr:hypothetical protein [Nanoarchaeota archaeon]
MRQGQAEILIIVGIVVVLVVVVFYVTQMLPGGGLPVSGIENQKRLVESSIKLSISEAALATLDNISKHGGYISPQSNSVVINSQDVPYWQYRGELDIPNVGSNLAAGVESYLMESKEGIIEASTQTITIEEPRVTVNLLDDKIVLNVDMPTVLWVDEKPYPLDAFSVEVPSRLGSIVSFSDSFVRKSQIERFLETFTMASIMVSPFDGPTRTVPSVVILTECGQSVYKTWFDVKPEMENTIVDTLAHVYMPENYP